MCFNSGPSPVTSRRSYSGWIVFVNWVWHLYNCDCPGTVHLIYSAVGGGIRKCVVHFGLIVVKPLALISEKFMMPQW